MNRIHEAPPRLIVITDTTLAPRDLLLVRVARILALAPPRTVLVQLRDNDLTFRERRALGEALAAECARFEQWLGVNDRVDLAVLLGAPALHLGERSISAADARRLLHETSWISRACHDPEAVTTLDADAVVLSPILQPRKGRPALGLDALVRVRASIDGGARVPRVYALGGIDASSAKACLDAGADGVAVIGAALGNDDPGPLISAVC
jgi:thiamine-phosphate pyrophosphorylase